MSARARVATFLADRLGTPDRDAAIKAAAGWLAERRRARQAVYLAQDVAAELAARGYVAARVTSAQPLSAAGRQAVEVLLRRDTGANELELAEQVAPEVIGGVSIQTATAGLDATVRHRLARMVEGVRHG
ncbi:MAG TPA: F0F1 ATP synthase subunit delta [Candidatus Saccharimonas sp.]|nr:F0F1 ATP synthase subunit delta [Candidatus Saccharimonas sp.]